MTIYYGVVKGNVVVLPEGIHLTEGLVVEIRVRASNQERSEQLSPESQFKLSLVESGLLTEIKAPLPRVPESDRTPIEVKGSSLSQTIIEERR